MAQHDAAGAGRICEPEPEPAMKKAIRIMQKFAVPLITGVVTALLWANIHLDSYNHFLHGSLAGGWEFLGHEITPHFLVNDIFMCFFFGLAIKEVTSSLLPGGPLSPIRKAINPLMATAGGVCGPAIAYMASVTLMYYLGFFQDYQCGVTLEDQAYHVRRLSVAHSVPASQAQTDPHLAMAFAAEEVQLEQCKLATFLNGWGVPTATDISLAWMFAAQIFGEGHPAVNFLLLLAIIDDAIGLVIIAIFYPDPTHPVEPFYLVLVVVAMALALGLRKCKVNYWSPYILLCGPFAWFGLLQAHVHPALALCVVVPFMPSAPQDSARHDEEQLEDNHVDVMAELKAQHSSHHAALDAFEHTTKLPVDIGMFFFGLTNAGVELNTVGGLTISVFFALIVGKTLGIAGMALLASKLGFPLPEGVTTIDVFAMGAVGGIGLTVALFVANEAFVDHHLACQAKFAAVLSVLSAGLAWVIRCFGTRRADKSELQASSEVIPQSVGKSLDADKIQFTTVGVSDSVDDFSGKKASAGKRGGAPKTSASPLCKAFSCFGMGAAP